MFEDIVKIIPFWIKLKKNDVVLDIGCNDGTLLKHYKKLGSFFRIGIDPALNVEKYGKCWNLAICMKSNPK